MQVPNEKSSGAGTVGQAVKNPLSCIKVVLTSNEILEPAE